MGITISATDDVLPFNRVNVVLKLECDDVSAIFCRGEETFDHPDGFPVQHSQAMQRGWLERQGPSDRIWLCPECSGK